MRLEGGRAVSSFDGDELIAAGLYEPVQAPVGGEDRRGRGSRRDGRRLVRSEVEAHGRRSDNEGGHRASSQRGDVRVARGAGTRETLPEGGSRRAGGRPHVARLDYRGRIGHAVERSAGRGEVPSARPVSERGDLSPEHVDGEVPRQASGEDDARPDDEAFLVRAHERVLSLAVRVEEHAIARAE